MLEFGLRWLERHAPARDLVTLCHRDFRTGNYMVDEHGLTGVLDSEFTGWSDPLEDIGWSAPSAGALARWSGRRAASAPARTSIAATRPKSGRKIDRDAVRYWEVMAHLTWAVIAIQQGQRHVSGEENSLLLALTGQIVPELEWEILNMTEND